MKRILKISDETLILIMLAFMAFSISIWSNYRQLWLQDFGFNLAEISKILSVALICSAIISFVISLFSTEVKIKDVLLLGMIIRSCAMTILVFNPNTYVIKICTLLCIMCETMFSIGFYPLLSTVNKSSSTYRKQSLINYISKDAGIIICGLLIGVVVGNRVFDYNSCLFLSLISSVIAICILLLYAPNKIYKKGKVLKINVAIKNLFKSKINNIYLFIQFVVNISYGLIFGLMMLLLTDYIEFSVAFASIFIIGANVLGSIMCSFFIKYGKKISVKMSNIIKYGTRVLFYFLAFLFNNRIWFIIAVVFSYITYRLLDDKINGVYIRNIDTDSQFLFGNIRYFVLSIGEGVGTYLAGYILQISFNSLFLAASIVTLLQVILYFGLDNLRQKDKTYMLD